MKKFLLSLFAISALISSQAQSSCEDTLTYPLAKATADLGVTMNVPSEFSGYAQYYDTPEPVIVKGFKIYLGVGSSNPLDTAIVTGLLFEPQADSTPGTITRQKDFTVYNTYDIANLETMAYYCMFDTPDTMTNGFLVGSSTTTTQPLGIVGNDYNAGNGGMEELGFWRWHNDMTWYPSNEFFAWDVDFYILPIVEYLPVQSFVGPQMICEGTNVCYHYTPSPILNHRMYNENVFNGDTAIDNLLIDWGDGNTSLYNDTCHTYSVAGNYQIVSHVPTGWNTGCDVTDTVSLQVDPTYDINVTDSGCESYYWDATGTNYTTGGTYVANLVTMSGCDSTVTLDLTINTHSTSNITETACFSYTSPSGNVWTTSGVYPDTIPNATGCDSLMFIDLTITTVDTTVTQSGVDLSANASGATYQWVECPAMTPISGETSQNFTATTNGDYAVEVTENGCTNTSDCYTVNSVSIVESKKESIEIFPNPTHGELNIQLSSTSASEIKVYNVIGKLIETHNARGKDFISFDIEGPSGYYLIKVIDKNGVKAVRKVLKK